jgi:hypothetical protein
MKHMIETTHEVHEVELRALLEKKIVQAIEKYPLWFDQRLFKGLDRLVVNSSDNFLTSRSILHLQKILLAQFFLQKRMEAFFGLERVKHPLTLKTFCCSFRIGIALVVLDSYRFQKEQFLKAFQILLPGVQEIPQSFYLWHHPEFPYFFCYFEVYKMRGEQLSVSEIKKLQRSLQEQLHTAPPLTPTLFWPYNEEESF